MKRLIEILAEETRSLRELGVLSMAFKRLWNKSSRKAVVLAIAFAILEAALFTLDPYIVRRLFDVLGRTANQPLAQFLAAVGIAVSIGCYAAFNTSTWYSRNATYDTQVRFGTEAFAHILKLGMDFHTKSRKGEVLEKTEQTITQCQDFLYNSFFGNFLRIGLSSAFILAVTFSINHKLFFIYVAILSVGLYTNLMFGSRISKEEKDAWKIVSDCQAVSLDVIQNVKEVKIFCNEDFEIERRKKLAESQLVPLKRSALLWRSLTTIENLWQNFGFGVAMFPIILPMAMNHQLTVGQVAQLVLNYAGLYRSFMDVLFKLLNAKKTGIRMKDLKAIMDKKPCVVDLPDTIPFPGMQEELAFRYVTFAYEQQGVMEDVTFAIKKGGVTIITGESGCGKSTIASLLLRLYDPTMGRVMVDGFDIRNFEQNSYRRMFTFLSQDAYLFRETIAYNISYSRIGSSYEAIVRAAKTAQIHDFIMSLPNQYDTIVSERAANISGGQKQRIALARAVLAEDAEIVILDEPTTGLDNQNARKFMDELIRVFSGKTIVVVAHDTAIMRRADQIVYIADGRVAGIGTHDELVARSSGYKELILAP